MISSNKYTGSCNVLSPKICVPKETKNIYIYIYIYIYINAFNMNKDETTIRTEHTSCDYKCKLNNARCNSNQEWNNKTCQCE